jgi:FHA domain-containing protein
MQLGGRKAGAAPVDDPFADLLGGTAASKTERSGFDDFSDLAGPPSGSPLRVDDMFGGAGSGGIGGDPLALSPLSDPLRQPNTSSDDDPFAALQATPKPSAKPRGDHLPIERFGYVPPKEVAPAPAPVPAPAPAPRASPPAPVAPPRAPAPVAATASDEALWAAFLRGVKSTHQLPEALTPELMERIGVLLRGATEGTLQLLLARQEIKRGVRAEVTMIGAQANNPLKFSPTTEVALAHLLGPTVRGFMPPEAAMRDAYDDLRAHEFGVMVGMRAALAHVIARFAPEELESKIAAKTALDSLFAANRKAKLWDQFVALYAGIAAEAEDDFHSLFGKAFLQAYEEQMARLKSGK